MDEQKPNEQNNNDEQVETVNQEESINVVNEDNPDALTESTQTPGPVDTSQLFTPDSPSEVPKKEPKKKFGKKKIIVIFLILLAGGAAAWWFFVRKDTTPTNSNSQATNQQQTNQPQSDFKTPDNIIYAFREADDAPMTIYSRPINGGDRKELVKLAKTEFPGNYDVRNNIIAYSTDQAIFVSTDGGTTFKKIYDLKQGVGGQLGEQVTSLKIDNNADNLVVGLLGIDATQNSVNQFGLDGSGQKELFKAEKPGAFIYEWSQSLGKLIYSQGCYNCDGNQPTPLVWNQKNNQSVELSSSIKPGTLIDTDLNGSNGQLVVVYGNVDTTSQGLGVNVVAPYKISRFDINSDQYNETIVKTLGTAGEKNPNGTVRSRSVIGGFLWQTDDIYYTDDKQMFFLTTDKESLALTSDKNITQTNFVSSGNIIYRSNDNQSTDFMVNNYDVQSKQSSQVLNGDANTFIFGVTTK